MRIHTCVCTCVSVFIPVHMCASECAVHIFEAVGVCTASTCLRVCVPACLYVCVSPARLGTPQSVTPLYITGCSCL
jgi:hypothetical protein